MADSNMQLQWTDDQWNRVRQVVYEEARKARVAGNVLPLYGPLDPDSRYVSMQQLYPPTTAVPGFTVDDTEALRLTTIRELVYLRGAQVADPELTSALIAFRRAANQVARREDIHVFTGSGQDDEEPGTGHATHAVQPRRTQGLVAAAEEFVEVDRAFSAVSAQDLARLGQTLVTAVSNAVGHLEENYHIGPFACVLGQTYFNAVQTPTPSLVLPQDRILPFLGGGPLVRSSILPEETGLVIALSGAPIDLVVASDISVKFMQVTVPDPWYVFRVFEKIALRVNQPGAIALLAPEGTLAQQPAWPQTYAEMSAVIASSTSGSARKSGSGRKTVSARKSASARKSSS